MSSMDELVQWLRARLDEDAEAQRGAFDRWHHRDCESLPDGDQPTFECNCGVPARVLRDIESRRQQVEWCVEVIGDRDLSRYKEFGSLKDDPDALAVTLAVETLRLLASVYADDPSYRREWLP